MTDDTETDLVAFLDESRKPPRDRATGSVGLAQSHVYVVAAAVVLRGDHDEIREVLDRLHQRIDQRLHYRDLGVERRREVLDAVADIDAWDGYLIETSRPLPAAGFSEHHVRAKLVEAAFAQLSELGVIRAVFESRGAGHASFRELDQRDHGVARKMRRQGRIAADLRVDHSDKSERLLEIPDLLAGARTDALCGVDAEMYPRLAHRVRHTIALF